METKLDNDKSPFCWTPHSPRAPRRTAHGAAPPARGPSPACAPRRPHAPSSAAGSSPRSRSRGPGGPATAGWRLEERGGGERHGQAPACCPGQACELPTGSLCPHGHAPARAHRLASAVRAASGHLRSPLRVGRTEGGGQPLDRAGGRGTGVMGTGKRGRPQAPVQRRGPRGECGQVGQLILFLSGGRGQGSGIQTRASPPPSAQARERHRDPACKAPHTGRPPPLPRCPRLQAPTQGQGQAPARPRPALLH